MPTSRTSRARLRRSATRLRRRGCPPEGQEPRARPRRFGKKTEPDTSYQVRLPSFWDPAPALVPSVPVAAAVVGSLGVSFSSPTRVFRSSRAATGPAWSVPWSLMEPRRGRGLASTFRADRVEAVELTDHHGVQHAAPGRVHEPPEAGAVVPRARAGLRLVNHGGLRPARSGFLPPEHRDRTAAACFRPSGRDTLAFAATVLPSFPGVAQEPEALSTEASP
jgi:hypothetical protein